MIKDAIIDSTGAYRYSLWRIWNPDLPKVLFVMLNPSTADASIDDPTIRRCIGFAKAWGFGSLEVVNLFAYRATDPEELKKCSDPIGPNNDYHIRRAAHRADKIIAAWGTKGSLLGRDRLVMEIFHSFPMFCLDVSKAGHPKHPLYIKADSTPAEYSGNTA
ncbi:DUF1643 domain-containing protein [Paenibacillus koleovorans]|uniref:DUF1643 domain-containing protein n=1 Tax=Paenibacillus koleovorans TaxID=121608 RepID=UPI000FD838FA|nr:DUF1643 domain-containing protein [Paenibacillus koleovorans]